MAADEARQADDAVNGDDTTQPAPVLSSAERAAGSGDSLKASEVETEPAEAVDAPQQDDSVPSPGESGGDGGMSGGDEGEIAETTADAETTAAVAAPKPDTEEEAPRPRPPRRRRPPPPKKGILRPPSSSHAATSRFSFRRDILQPFNSSYARVTTAVHPPAAGGNAADAAAAVGEAVGNAATVAGGFFGNAFKRLSAAATASAVGAQPGTQASGPSSGSQPGAPPPNIDASRSPAPGSPTVNSPAANTAGFSSSKAASPTLPQIQTGPAPAPAAAPPSHPLPVSSLKLVRFRMSSLKVVYPINHGTLDPIAPYEEAETRDRVEEEWRKECGLARPEDEESQVLLERKSNKGKVKAEGIGASEAEDKARELPHHQQLRTYTGEELAQVYAESCRTREEPGIDRLKRLLRENPRTPPKVIDLSHELLSFGAVAALSDVLAVDFGCKKLVLDGCGLDDESLKPLLHALLVSGSIPTVSLAGNKRIRNKGWKYLAVFLRKATFLRYLDLSETSIDRKAAEWLAQAVAPPTPPAASVSAAGREPDAGDKAKPTRVRGPWEEEDDSDEEGVHAGEDGSAPRDEVAEAGTEQDAEEADLAPRKPLFDSAPLLREEWSGEKAAVQSLRLENCGLRGPPLEALANGLRTSNVKHVSLRKNRINYSGGPALAIIMRDYPLSTDSSVSIASALNGPALSSPTIFRNGFSNGTTETTSSTDPSSAEGRNSVTAHRRHPFKPIQDQLSQVASTSSQTLDSTSDETLVERGAPVPSDREMYRMTEARTRLRKQIDALPRFGALLTLDVKGNDLRHGVTYIAQVLKRNRTLKTLNLSENRIDSHGLTALAESLKYNATLETLDMSHNPCCGPGVDGILAMRSALMVSHSLKRIFLNSTELTSEGAIALAEFLPESRSVLHLDLTNNNIDISGVLALSVSIKLNSTIRCLDLNIPPNDPDFSRLSQDILNTCVRNTEMAQEKADAEAQVAADGGKRVLVAQPIRKSALANELEEQQRAEERRRRKRQETLRSQQDIVAAAAETRDVVRELLMVDEAAVAQGETVRASEIVRDALVQLQLAEAQLAEAAPATGKGEERNRVDSLLAELAQLLDLAKSLYDAPPLPAKDDAEAITTAASPLPPVVHGSPRFSPEASSESGSEEDLDVAPEPLEEISGGPGRSKPDAIALPTKEDLLDADVAAPPLRSPMESESRAMVEEESEVFRRGVALGVDEVSDEEDEEDDGEVSVHTEEGGVKKKSDVSGEELRKELLETPVRRSPRTSFSSDTGVGMPPRMSHRSSSSPVE